MPDPQKTPERLVEVVKYLKYKEGNFDYLSDSDKEIMRKSLNRLRRIAEVTSIYYKWAASWENLF